MNTTDDTPCEHCDPIGGLPVHHRKPPVPSEDETTVRIKRPRPGIAIVVGGHDEDLGPADLGILAELLVYLGVKEVWHGDAAGVDACADSVARSLGLFVRYFRATTDGDATRARRDRDDRMVMAAHSICRTTPVTIVAFKGDAVTDRLVRIATGYMPVIDLRGRP